MRYNSIVIHFLVCAANVIKVTCISFICTHNSTSSRVRMLLCAADATERSGAQEALECREGRKSQRIGWRWQQQRRQQVRRGWVGRWWRGPRTSRWTPDLLIAPATGVAKSRLTPRRSRWSEFCVPNRRWRCVERRSGSAA